MFIFNQGGVSSKNKASVYVCIVSHVFSSKFKHSKLEKSIFN